MEQDPASHGGEGVRVKGCKNDGGSVNEECNGLYTCLPPYQNVEGHKHYVHVIDAETRRHIIRQDPSANARWMICPVCHEDEGAVAMTQSKQLTGKWETIPPDKREVGVTVTFLAEGGGKVPILDALPPAGPSGLFGVGQARLEEARRHARELAAMDDEEDEEEHAAPNG